MTVCVCTNDHQECRGEFSRDKTAARTCLTPYYNFCRSLHDKTTILQYNLFYISMVIVVVIKSKYNLLCIGWYDGR